MTRLRRILFFSDAATLGGHEMMAVRAAAGLARRGHSVTFAAFSGNVRLHEAIRGEIASGTTMRRVETRIGALRLQPLQAPFRWSRMLECAAVFRRERPDALILVQGRIEAASSAVLAARLSGRKPMSYLPMAHSLSIMGTRVLPRIRDQVNKWYFRSIERFVVISSQVASDVRSQSPGARCAVVENVIAPPKPVESALGRSECRSRLGLSIKGRWIGVFGRLSMQQKGHDRLLRALAIAPSLHDVKVAFVGDGPDAAQLTELAIQLGVNDRVSQLGWKDVDLMQAYRAVDVVALPSRFEGVPLVMLEALAHRTPVIASAIDGMREWLPPEATFDGDIEADIARAFHAATDGSVAFEQAFARALKRCDSSSYGSEWESALDELLPIPEQETGCRSLSS